MVPQWTYDTSRAALVGAAVVGPVQPAGVPTVKVEVGCRGTLALSLQVTAQLLLNSHLLYLWAYPYHTQYLTILPHTHLLRPALVCLKP